MWRAYVKDIQEITQKPKAFLKIREFDTTIDALVSSSSTIQVEEVPSNVSNGDIVEILNPQGMTLSSHVIKSINDKSIQLAPSYELFNDTTLYTPIPSLTAPMSSDNHNWRLITYDYDKDYPTPADFEGQDIWEVENLSLPYGISSDYGEGYGVMMKSYFYFNQVKNLTLYFMAVPSGTVTIDGQLIGSIKPEEDTPVMEIPYTFNVGWHEVILCYSAKTSPNGIILASGGTEQNPRWLENDCRYTRRTAIHHLEGSIVNTLKNYCTGKIGGYTDTLRALELGSFQITNTTDTIGRLENKKANSTINMSKWLYEMFEKYQIYTEITIPFEGSPQINVFKPSYTPLKIGSNSSLISSISPTLKVEQTNKLVIFSSKGIYRATYISKSDGTYVKEPSSNANRFEVINTKFVFTDDEEEEEIVQNNLPQNFYNHKLTFILRTDAIYSGAYDISVIAIGRPLQIWNGTEFFSTIVTGVRASKGVNQELTQIEVTCGMVRIALTDKLRLGVVNAR